MTNADTILLAIKDLPVSNINPFTGNKLISDKENGVEVYSCADLNPEHYRNSYVFELDEKSAWKVSDNIFDENNWINLAE